MDKFQKEENFINAVKKANLSEKLTSNNPHDLPEIKRLQLPKFPRSNLILLVGESGIGKTASICLYAKILSDQGHPVLYYSLDQQTIKLESFLLDAFGTTRITEIYNMINKNFVSKNITPTMIIDNIHYCQNDLKSASDLLNFINDKLFQKIGCNVIMVSSNNSCTCKLGFHFILLILVYLSILKYLESIFENQLEIKEVNAYPKEYILSMLKPNEADEYYDLFGSNLNELQNFLQYDISLEGIFLFVILYKKTNFIRLEA